MGWAEKESHDFEKKWQERYFVIESSALSNAQSKVCYYEVNSNNYAVLKGEYQLNKKSVCKRVGDNHKKNKKNVILVTGVSKNNILDSEMAELYISVPSPSLVNDWIDVMNKAINNQQILPQVIEELEAEAESCSICSINFSWSFS